jgi:hypothetical protein
MSQYKYAINLQDGRIVFYNSEVATQTAYAAIPTDIALAVGNKELDWHQVVELIHKKRNNDPNFSWELFDKLRDRQNIRRAKYDPETLGEEPKEQVNEEKMLEAGDISMDDLRAPLKEATKEPKPGKRVGKSVDNVSQVSAAARPSDDVTLTI